MSRPAWVGLSGLCLGFGVMMVARTNNPVAFFAGCLLLGTSVGLMDKATRMPR